MKKILLIAYSYPPLEDAQSLRWYYISHELARLGYLIDVVTIKHPDGLQFSLHENIRIHRVYAGFFENIAYRVKNKIGVDKVDNQEQRKSFSFSVMKKAYWLVRSFIGAILPGNITSEWYPFVRHYIKKNIDVSTYSYMITSHEPWVDSLVGYKIKKEYPAITWIADFADPYVSIYTPNYKLFFENYIEKKLYLSADLMILTNQKVLELLEQKYPFLSKKNTLILEQGFKKRELTENRENKIFSILYTGTFYKDFRNPIELSKALKSLNFDFRFIVAGRNEKFNYLFESLGDKYKFLGFTPHKSVLKLQDSSDLLVHLSNRQTEQVPGKFFEYLGVGKPILVIYQDEGDQLIELSKKIGIETMCINESKKIIDQINKVYKNKNIPNYKNTLIDDYSWKNRTKKLVDRIGTM